MAAWAQAQGSRTAVTMRVRPLSTGYPKNSASVELEIGDALGLVTIWESGECKIDLGSKTDAHRTLIRSGEVSTAEEVDAWLDSAIEFASQLPGRERKRRLIRRGYTGNPSCICIYSILPAKRMF